MTDRTDRRAFIKTAIGAAAGALVAAHLPARAAEDATQAPQGAEVIFHGGTIVTMDDARREVQAVAVAGGKILAAGDEAEVMKTRTDATQVVDLGGKTLMPSFIDAHGHFMNAPQIVKWANVSGPPVGPVTKIADIVTVLQDHVKNQRIERGEWIIGYGYDRSNLAEGRELLASELDPAFPDNPVMLIHSSNHGAVLNSAAFKAVGYDESTPTPPGGIINRIEGTNKPAGFLMETAFLPIFGSMPQPPEREMLDTLDAAQQLYASVGVTTCQEGATHAKDLAFLRKAAAEGLLYLDIVSLPLILEVPALLKEYAPSFQGGAMELPEETAQAFGHYKDRLKLQGFKVISDKSHTWPAGWMRISHLGRAGLRCNRASTACMALLESETPFS
jgi:predicted amidohydrolase YtcJ